ncbi:MAG: DNA polymerase III subunit gamma/tau [Arcobacter sp.]|nr:DNA polymerase III subunit gamma/tau [Arcobacter sp.]
MIEERQKRVLALKYRPKKFEDLVGQSTVSQTLSLALDSNRLSHAYLFSGLRGSGKTSTARIMAKALLCDKGPTSKPCDVCDNCKSANASRHLDMVEMDAASNRGIDDIKDLIEHTKYKPSSARFKVFIIDEVHMLTTQAFNALLKTLEEPPSFVKFILATTDPLKLPATILSRTQHFRFNKIAQSDVIHHLCHILNEENIDYETEALEILSRSGQGSLRDTLTMLDQAIIFSKGKVTTNAVVDMLGLIDPDIMDKIFMEILNKGDITKIVKELESYEISQVCDEMSIYLKHRMLEKDSRFSLLLYDRFFRILSDSKHLLAINSDGVFVLILTLMKMMEATTLKTIDEVINQVEKIQPEVDKKIGQNQKEEQKEIVIKKVVETPIEKKKEETILQKESQEVPIEKEPNSSLNIASLDVIDSVSSMLYPNPFDEEEIENKKVDILENTDIVSIEEDNPQIKINPNEEIEVIPFEETIEEEGIQKEPLKNELYEKLTKKVYDRDYDLGECFEKNFIFKAFQDNKLSIVSLALGDDRKFLYKHFSLIRTFVQDVFGSDVELDFIKENPRQT